MSSIVTPFGGNGGGYKKPKLTEINEYTITGNSQTKNYSKNFSNGGFVIITGKDGFLCATGYGSTTTGEANYYMGSVNILLITSLTIDGISVDNSAQGGYGVFDYNVLTSFSDFHYATDYFANQTTLAKNLIMIRHIIPVKTNIDMTIKIGHNAQTGTEGRFVFYKFDYQTS